VRCREEPSPSSPDRRCCLGCPWARLLDVRGRRISSNPTSIARGDIRAAMGSVDQIWGRLFFLVVVINNSDKPAPLGCSSVRGRPWPIMGPTAARTASCYRWLCSHWPLGGHPIVGGRRLTVPLLVAAGVSLQPEAPYRAPVTHTPLPGPRLRSTQRARQIISTKYHDFHDFGTLQKDYNYLGIWLTQLIGVHSVVASHEAAVAQVEQHINLLLDL